MQKKTYYPDSNEGRAAWWQNIQNVGESVLTALGLSAAQIASIMADAGWGVYLYRTLRMSYEEAGKGMIGYANTITDGPMGAELPDAPPMPTWPDPPAMLMTQGIEGRREMWVQTVKNTVGYDAGTIGATLRLEAPVNPFVPANYTAQVSDLSSPAAKQLRFKFSKAYGEIDGVNLYGRKTGDTVWILLGRFTAAPGNATVPLTGTSPEEWQFEARAVKRDVEIGNPSPVSSVIIRA